MNKWEKLADKATIDKTIAVLKGNGIAAYFTADAVEARKKVFEILPQSAEVMTMTSMTLEALNVAKEINESGKYNSVRNKLLAMDHKTQGGEMQKMGAAPEWVVGSVHAVTEKGEVMLASASGSQLPAYAGGSAHVIWVVGVQKIVKDIDEGFKRIYEHCLALENVRAMKAYGMASSVNKILIISKEYQPARISLIFVNQLLGF